MSEEKRLLPCPFCGNEKVGYGIIPSHPEQTYYYGICENCHTQGPLCSAENVAFMAWNALPRALRWTKEPPTKPGWYWTRFSDKTGKPKLLEIKDYELKTAQGIAEWEWAGPIPEPKEK